MWMYIVDACTSPTIYLNKNISSILTSETFVELLAILGDDWNENACLLASAAGYMRGVANRAYLLDMHTQLM